jgi:uncharacterized protein YegL
MNASLQINWLTISDKSPNMAWVTDEASRKPKMAAWSTLSCTLIKRWSHSVLLRQGVHHVLKNQKENRFKNLFKTLTKALELESLSLHESTAMAAYDILKRMKASS